MTTVTIEQDVAQSRVLADTETIVKLRSMIAYRESALPPVAVQKLIKGFIRRPLNAQEAAKRDLGAKFLRAPRLGTQADLDYLYAVHGTELIMAGWPRSKLPAHMFEAVLRMRGYWDGWTPLVTPAGVFGSGLVPHVARALTMRLGHAVNLVDLRRPPTPATQGPTHLNPLSAYRGPLRAQEAPMREPDVYDFQAEALAAWMGAGGQGVVDLPPRSGKTRVAIKAVHQLQVPTLMVVPRKVLVAQTVAAFREFFPKSMVIGVTGGRPNAKKQRALNNALVWVATPQTAAGPKDKATKARTGITGLDSRQFLIIDEFHHGAASTYQSLSRSARNAYYRLGLTGTHYRADGRDMLMHSILSRKVYSRSVADMVALGRLVPAKVAMVRLTGQVHVEAGQRTYAACISECEERNRMLAWAARELMRRGRRVLVLTTEVRHAQVLASMIPGALQVDGSSSEEVRPALERLGRRDVQCVVGTSVIGEGVDVPAADALVYAAGGKSKVKVVQDFFRVLTASDGKSTGLVIDCADNHSHKVVKSAAHRLGLYRRNFETEVVEGADMAAWLSKHAPTGT